LHRRPPRRGLDRLRRQPRGTAPGCDGRAARVGRHDVGAGAAAARAAEARRGRTGVDRSAEQPARRQPVRGRRGAAVHAGHGAAADFSAWREHGGRRGRRRRPEGAEGEELARPPAGPMTPRLMRQTAALFALVLAACAAPQPAPVESAPPPAVAAPPVEQPAPVPPPAPSSTAKESVAVAGLMDTPRTDAAARRLPEAAATPGRPPPTAPRHPPP